MITTQVTPDYINVIERLAIHLLRGRSLRISTPDGAFTATSGQTSAGALCFFVRVDKRILVGKHHVPGVLADTIEEDLSAFGAARLFVNLIGADITQRALVKAANTPRRRSK